LDIHIGFSIIDEGVQVVPVTIRLIFPDYHHLCSNFELGVSLTSDINRIKQIYLLELVQSPIRFVINPVLLLKFLFLFIAQVEVCLLFAIYKVRVAVMLANEVAKLFRYLAIMILDEMKKFKERQKDSLFIAIDHFNIGEDIIKF